MNGFDRITSALEGRMPDRVPIMLHNFLMAAREAGYTQEAFRSNAAVVAESFIRAVERYRYDGVLIDIDTAVVASALGVPTQYPEDKPARTHGALLSDLANLQSLSPVRLEESARVQVLLDATRLVKERVGDDLFVRGNCDQAPFSLASMIRSTSDWMLDIAEPENSSLALDLLEYCTDAACQMIRLMAQTGCDMVSNGDSPAGPSMISPTMFRALALPFERRCVEEAHRQGLPYALHICGDTTLILDDMVATGTDALELDYLTEVNRVRTACGDSVCFIGNLDPSGVLALGSVEQVSEATSALLRVCGDSPRFILNAGCAIPAETPSQNIQAMISTARAFSRS